MTRHRDQIAHIQRTGLNAGRKVTVDVDDEPGVFCCDACGAWCDAEDCEPKPGVPGPILGASTVYPDLKDGLARFFLLNPN